MKTTKYIWKNGKLIPWAEATTHVLTHALHYASGVFEGIRAYETPKGPAIFRGLEHYNRLEKSAKIYKMSLNYSPQEMLEASTLLLKENGLGACYIRPLAYYGYGEMGLNPRVNPIDTIIAAWEWGTYLGDEGLEKGIRTKISSWTKFDARMLPPQSKCTANYANSILAKQEALDEGYDEAILLNTSGTIAEGPGENLFMVRDGHLYSPPTSDGSLDGITANAIIQIAKDAGYSFAYKRITKDELFLADELFFTGTAAEVTPIREVSGRVIGSGKRGPITEKIQSKFFDVVHGKDPAYASWLNLVENNLQRS